MRDRTADLFAASEALSQLSYSPVTLLNLQLNFNVPFEQLLVESEAHSKQPPIQCQQFFWIKVHFFQYFGLTD